MSARCPALLLAALSLVPACFNDDGKELTHTATSLPPDSSTTSASAPTTTTTTGDPGATTTTTTPDPTTGPSTVTTLTTGTTAEPECPGEKQCQPGEVMNTGALCDPCGRTQLTCQPDCTWGAEVCAEDLTSCLFWYYETNLKQWTRVPLLEPAPAHAPAAAIEAAFDLWADHQIVALTADRYHVLSLPENEWVASGALSDMFPDLGGPVLQAFSVYNQDPDAYDVVVVTGAFADSYSMNSGSYQAAFVQTDPCCDSWTPQINPGAIESVRDIFLDLDNLGGWAVGEVLADCFDNQLHPLVLYSAWITPTNVYLQDVGYCFKLVSQLPYGGFKPFSDPGAPPGDLVGGAALLGERLYIFAGD